jgi:hypothetical protein
MMKNQPRFKHLTTEEIEEKAYGNYLEKKQYKAQKIFLADKVKNNPVKQVFNGYKAQETIRKKKGLIQVTLPTLKFMENANE